MQASTLVMQASKSTKEIILAKRKNYSRNKYFLHAREHKEKNIKDRRGRKVKKKQESNRLAGQHPDVKEAPENKLFSKLEKKIIRNSLHFTPQKTHYIYAYLL